MHQLHERVESILQRRRIAQHAALVAECSVGYHPALPTLADDLVDRHAHVGEEGLVKLGVPRHRAQRAHLDARRLHREDQVADPRVLGRARLGPHQAKDHVCLMRGASPDFLPVDDELAILLARAGAQRRQVRAGARLGVALAPDDFATQRRRDPTPPLLLGAELEQGWNKHGDALVRQPPWHARRSELLGDDARLEDVGFGAKAAIFAWNSTRGIAVLEQQLLPCHRVRSGTLRRARCGRRTVAVGRDERAQLVAEGCVFGAVAQIHCISLLQPE